MQDKKPEVSTIENDIFYTTFGKNTRLELKNGFFKAGKLTIGLQKFDDSNKQIAYISQYLDLEKALCLADDILSGRIDKKARDLSAASSDGKPVKVYQSQGGQSAEKANRSDNKPLYREFSIYKGNNWMFKSAEGPGKITSTLGIAADGPCEKQVVVGANSDTLREFALMIKSEYQAYGTAQYLKS